MSIFDPTDTLSYHRARVLTQKRDMSATPTANVAAACKAFMATDSNKTAQPESEALWFYALNHGMALLSADRADMEPLSKDELEFVQTYHAQMTEKATRAFYYLLLICTRECRHTGSIYNISDALTQKFGASVYEFIKNLTVDGESNSVHKLMANPPKASIGAYVKALAYTFYHGSFSSSYGGPAWGKVTDCLVSFVHGEYTAEMMLDTVWTLCHNGGPIFNKGMLYAQQSTPKLKRLLDIQRGGQIPQAILAHDHHLVAYMPAPLRDAVGWMQTRFPGAIASYVDWYAVEALGSLSKYPDEKMAQAKVYGLPESAAIAEKMAAAQKAAEAAKLAAKEAEYKAHFFDVMPGVTLKKVQRKEAA